MDESRTLDIWLKRAAWLFIILLLGSGVLFMWRMSQLVAHLDSTIAAVSSDVKQVTQTAADVSRQVNAIIERMDRLEEKADLAFHVDELESILTEMGEVTGDTVPDNIKSNPVADSEIRYLLNYVRKSGLNFEYSGKEKSDTMFYLQLYAKYKSYAKTLTSAEDFIAECATKTIAGNIYYVNNNGEKTELAVWLSDALTSHRRE